MRAGFPHLGHPLLEAGARLRGRAADGNADRQEAADLCDLAELAQDAFILLPLQVDGDAFEQEKGRARGVEAGRQ